MANQEHLNTIMQGVEVWNQWRAEHPDVPLDLRGVDFNNLGLNDAPSYHGIILITFGRACLRGIDLKYADLSGAELNAANLQRADLRGAILEDAFLNLADLSYARLNGARLKKTILNRTILRSANLSYALLESADLGAANLHRAKGSYADFARANLEYANLNGADFKHANFTRANFDNTNLRNTKLNGADFTFAEFKISDLCRADFKRAKLHETYFTDVDLSEAQNLDQVLHEGPCNISISTIYRSKGDISDVFLKGAGVPNTMIEYMRSLVVRPIDYYTCFISYSSKDDAFAKRLYADLQTNGVRCWFAPEDMKIGDKIRTRIDESIRLYDKLLIVLSEASLASTWVAYEVEKALNKEPEGIPNVLFPIRLDTTILTCETEWAKEIRRSRHIGDFEHWKDHDAYQQAFQRLLRDLKAQS